MPWNRWDDDREELLQEWSKLNIFYRILFLLMSSTTMQVFYYLTHRAAVRPDRMVKVKDLHWDNISSVLRKNLFK